MKRLLSILLIFSCGFAYSQQVLMYQAVLRNNAGEVLSETRVSIKVSIKDSNNIVVYTENISDSTNSNGLVTFLLGTTAGSMTPNANFKSIAWEEGKFCIKLENDGGTDFKTQDYQPISSVPWSFAAFGAAGDLDDRLEMIEAFLRSKGLIP